LDEKRRFEVPLQFLLWYDSKQKKGQPLFLAVVVVVKGEKVKVEIGSQELDIFVKILSAPS